MTVRTRTRTRAGGPQSTLSAWGPLTGLPLTSTHHTSPDVPNVGRTFTNEDGTTSTLGIMSTEQELFRMHTRPELYEEWQIEHADVMRVATLEQPEYAGLVEWDCHACRRNVLTHTFDERCPSCGV